MKKKKNKSVNSTPRNYDSARDDFDEKCAMGEIESTPKKVEGKHYDLPGVETIDVIENVIIRENLPRPAAYCIGNAIKYLLRCGVKNGENWKDDIAKAENYLHRAITGKWMEIK